VNFSWTFFQEHIFFSRPGSGHVSNNIFFQDLMKELHKKKISKSSQSKKITRRQAAS
jgi:hypothetical protein